MLNNDLNLKILNLLPSQPVLFCVNSIGKPSSKYIASEKKIRIGREKVKKIIEKNLSIRILINKGTP